MISIVPPSPPYELVQLRFDERADYLTGVKAFNDADRASHAQREELQLILRRALTTVPRHAAPSQPETCREFCELSCVING